MEIWSDLAYQTRAKFYTLH